MKLGHYVVTAEAPLALLLNVVDAQRVRFKGIPRLPGSTPREIAAAVLKHNAHKVLYAGQGHFRFMWVSDFGKALRGALEVLPHEYLEQLIDAMVSDSARQGVVRSCFTEHFGFHGFDMPYARADSLPWLIHSVHEYTRRTDDTRLLQRHQQTLQTLVAHWEAHHIENGLVASRITGDWMDTVLRPSSTYNNICALYMLRLLPALGLSSQTEADTFEKTLLKDRWRQDHFVDYAGTELGSVDSAVYALYFELFDHRFRSKMAQWLGAQKLDTPLPIRSALHSYDQALIPLITRTSSNYHSSIWLHLGLMYLNGLKHLNIGIAEQREAVEAHILHYGNVLEALSPDGNPYMSPFHATEYGLTMAAGQYLELVNDAR